MGPCEHPSTPPENQDTRPLKTAGCKRRVRRLRSRVCLLKGCECVFRPQHPLTRYCGEVCRQQARRWQEWKARRRYRRSAGCKQKRQAQSRRYRERQKARNRKSQLASHARVIPIKFFSVLLRPTGMLRPFPPYPAITVAAFLFAGLPSCSGAGSGAGETLARTAPRSGGKRTRQKKCPMKTCRYRPDILRLLRPSR